MANLDELNTLFSEAYSVRFKPNLNSLHLDIPDLAQNKFSEINSLLKNAALTTPLSLTLSFKNDKKVNLTIQSQNESITIDKLRPMYGLKEKLHRSSPETVELCLFNYRHTGIYIGTRFKLKLEE